MTPLTQLPAGAWRGVAGVFTDIDDTLTTSGAITLDALRALSALEAAGLPVIAVTGRPMGWSRPFAAAWPLRAIVAENGAVMLWRDAGGALQVGYAQDEATRAANARRLQAAAARILAELPDARLALDSPGRVTDIAIDHAEHARLDEAAIARVVALMHAQGMHATVSSIHVNGWFGEHDKWSGACWAVRERLARALPDEVGRWVYVGDSTNDQAMFARFGLSVGSIFAAMANTYVLGEILPETEAITMAEQMNFLGVGTIFLAVFISIASIRLVYAGREQASRRLDWWAFVGLGILYIVANVVVVKLHG